MFIFICLQYMFAALQDCFMPLTATKHVENSEQLLDQFHEEMCGYFRQVHTGAIVLASIHISFLLFYLRFRNQKPMTYRVG